MHLGSGHKKEAYFSLIFSYCLLIFESWNASFQQGYHPLEEFVFLLGCFGPYFRNICMRICSSIRFLTASNLLFSSFLSTSWDVSMSQPFEFVFVYSFFILSSHHHLNLDSIEDVFSKVMSLIAASSKRQSHNGR